MPSRDEIFEKVREALVDALSVEEDEVTPDATLRGDLEAESIDFLDIVFRLEKSFDIKIERGELFPEDILNNTDFVQDGKVNAQGIAKLKERMPFADVYDMLGVIYHQKGRLLEAEAMFEEAMRLNPNYTEAALNLAVTYNDQGKYEDARAVYDRILSGKDEAPRKVDRLFKGKIANMHAEVGHAFDEDWFKLSRDNPYRTLGLTSDASDAEIDQAYRRLISQYHPDKMAGAAEDLRRQAERKAGEINAAYDRIKTLRKRN